MRHHWKDNAHIFQLAPWGLKCVLPLGHSCLVKIKGPSCLVGKLSDTSISSSLSLTITILCFFPSSEMTFMIREIQCLIRSLIQYFLQVGTASPYLESRHPSHQSLNLIVTTSVLTKVLSSKFQKGMHAEKLFCLFP